jgi:hypothetical protein
MLYQFSTVDLAIIASIYRVYFDKGRKFGRDDEINYLK